MVDLQGITAEIREKYAREIPYTFGKVKSLVAVAEQDFLERNERFLIEKGEGEIRKELDDFYIRLFLGVLFCANEKAGFERALGNFLSNVMMNPILYDFLMENTLEFRSFEQSLSGNYREKLQKGREENERKGKNEILIKSAGNWQNVLENPILRDRVTMLRISRILAKE